MHLAAVFLVLLLVQIDCLADLLWFGTNEGLASQLGHVEMVWSTATAHGRNVVVVPYHSAVHYPDSVNSFSICDMFVLPSNIKCLPSMSLDYYFENRSSLMMNSNCSFAGPLTPEELEVTPFNLSPSTYDLPVLPSKDSPRFSWYHSTCVVGGSEYIALVNNSQITALRSNTKKYMSSYRSVLRRITSLTGGYPFLSKDWRNSNYVKLMRKCNNHIMTPRCGANYEKLPILFRQKYVVAGRKAKKRLLRMQNATKVIGVHWRRGDQAIRCDMGKDTSANCGNSSSFVDAIYRSIHRLQRFGHLDKRDALGIYVSTNEKNESDLAFLRSHGFMMYDDLDILPNEPSISRFAAEICILAKSNFFLSYGTSRIPFLVNRLRGQATMFRYRGM